MTRAAGKEIEARGGDSWLFDRIASGATMDAIADEIGYTRGVLYLWIKKGGEERQAGFRAARQMAAHGVVEDAGKILDELADREVTSPEVKLAEARAGHRRWLAEKYNRQEYGQPEQKTVVEIGELYLGALRKHGGADALPSGTAPLPVKDAEFEVEE